MATFSSTINQSDPVRRSYLSLGSEHEAGGGWTRFTRRCGEIAVAVRGCGSIAIVTAVFIFFMSLDQAAEALRI